jgi:hypothetical protein
MPNKHSGKVRNAYGAAAYYRRVLAIYPDALLAWQLSEAAGRTATEITGKTAAALDLLDNGGFETAGAGGADIWACSTESAGTGALADETVEVHAGGSAHAAKVTSGSSANTFVRQGTINFAAEIYVTPGTFLTFSFWTRGDGTNAGRYSIYDATNGVFIRTTVTTGVTGTTYTQVTYTFTVPATCYAIQLALLGPTANGGIAYFDDASLIGNIPYSGRYAAAGMTYGVAGIGDGKLAARFSGADTGLLIGSKAFGAFWNGNIGSVMGWGKVDGAARWTDAASYRYLFHPKSRQDGTVYIVIGKNQTNHQLVWRRRVAGATYEKTYTLSPTGPTTWFCMGFVWDRVSTPKRYAGYVYAPGHTAWTKVFDEAPGAGVGDQDWVNATYTVDDSNCVLAGGSLTAQEWFGDEYLCAYWAGVALTDAEMLRAMTPHGAV